MRVFFVKNSVNPGLKDRQMKNNGYMAF